MQKSNFVHLHVHSHYSLLDGSLKIEDLVKRARELGMPAVALTDHGNLFGAINFYQTALRAGIKPIIGYEAYVAPHSRLDKEPTSMEAASSHLTLLARNEKGYRNLIQLATSAYLEGFYYRPRVDKELLAEFAQGLVALSGCFSSEVARNLSAGRTAQARKVIEEYLDIFGRENFSLEVQSTGVRGQADVNRALAEIGKELGIPLVATNDVHYLKEEDAHAHDVLLCINTGKFLDDVDRMRLDSNQYYFKSEQEMAEVFADYPEAITNTQMVADMCNLELDFSEKHLPRFQAKENVSNAEYLRSLCEAGLARHYPEVTEALRNRLDRELNLIQQLGYPSYFLIVWDFIRFARENHIPVGLRGSGGGSLALYCLEVTSIDPVEHGILFERFMDESRRDLPDIDIDICQEGRGKLIEYVRQKYGRENVAQIITFGTMGARAVIRDVARVLRVPFDKADMIAKKVPSSLHITLEQALAREPELAALRRDDPQIQEIFDIAFKLEGLARHASVHAAGVVIADRPLASYVPLCRVGDEVVTQYDMDVLADIGLLKVDFLGLTALTVVDHTLKMIAATTGEHPDLSQADRSDPKTYEMLSRGDSTGVFQMESAGYRSLLQRMKPDKFEDLMALVALYRPGPLGGGMVESYVARKHGEEEITYEHPKLKEVLEETYGVMVYQDQVMHIVNELSDIPMHDAYSLIKAISKKNHEYITAKREDFTKGAVKHGIKKPVAEHIFDLISYFGGYGFNKSHATSYADLAFQTAYLKAHFPVQFIATYMTYESGNADKIATYLEECRKLDIPVLPPDVNESSAHFTVVEGSIRFGLAAIKNVGARAVEAVVQVREESGRFPSLYDFCERVDLRAASKGVLESLIKCGAMDSLGARRSQMLAVLEAAVRAGAQVQEDRRRGQMSFFQAAQEDAPSLDKDALPDLPEWPESQKLAYEKELLGVYLSSHPLAKHEAALKSLSSANTQMLSELEDNARVTLGGKITGLRILRARNGRQKGEEMAVITLEDMEGSCSAILFPAQFKKFRSLIREDAMVLVTGRLDTSREPPQIKVSQVKPLSEAAQESAGRVTIHLRSEVTDEELLLRLRSILAKYSGRTPVYLEINDGNGHQAVVKVGKKYQVNYSPEFAADVTKLLGYENLTLEPAEVKTPI